MTTYGPFDKYPEEDKDLPAIDWEKPLAGRTIITSFWTGETGLTISGDSATDTKTVVRVSGGTPGVTYILQNTVTWSDGQTRQVEVSVNVLADDVP